MNGKIAKKIRKANRLSAQESINAFRKMVDNLTFRRRLIVAWRIMWNNV
jgi:hypothetical protein